MEQGGTAAATKNDSAQRSAAPISNPSYLAIAEPQSFCKVLSLLPRDLQVDGTEELVFGRRTGAVTV